jgi:hypothetical protein
MGGASETGHLGLATGSEGAAAGAPAWYKDSRYLLQILLLVVTAFTLPFYRNLNTYFTEVHPALLAVLGGVFAGLLAYVPMLLLSPRYSLSHAVLVGLLVAEFNVYGAPIDLPAPIIISFFIFMHTYGASEADHLWPTTYSGGL